MTANIYEAKTHLSRLIAEAERGTEVTIARKGVPVVRLVPVRERPARKLGFLPTDHDIPIELFAPLTEDELALWEGSSILPETGGAS